MAVFLFVAFIVVPVIEIYIVTQAADQIGWPITLILVVGVSIAGAWLVKREGIGVIRRIRGALSDGKMPTNELADGAMIFFAAALMLTPGFLTDGLGLALLIPPIRALIRPPLISFFRKRVEVRTTTLGGPFGAGLGGRPGGFGRPRPGFGRDVYDVDGRADANLTDMGDAADADDPQGELGS